MPRTTEPSRTPSDKVGTICRALRRAIIEQALEPGAKLPEDALGERFGVSRTIARHALGQLAAEGLVELRRKPSVPIGEHGRDGKGELPEYPDRGVHLRAICAAGKQTCRQCILQKV